MKHLDLTGLQEIGRLFKAGLAGKADILHGHTADAVTMAADDTTTVAEEIAELKNSSADARDALATSISEKGVIVPEDATLASMAGYVDLIEANMLPKDDPYNSPGRQTLIAGTTTQGFFGEVYTAELITGTALAIEIGLSVGTAQFDNEPWLKFMLDEKVLFVAKKPYRHSISWDAINAANAVYGGKEISIGGNTYKVRLLKISLTDPCAYEGPSLHGGEWNRLMLPIHEEAQGGTFLDWYSIGPDDVPNDWGISYTDVQLHTHRDAGDGAASLVQETLDTDATMRLSRGFNGVSPAMEGPSSLVHAVLGWRPVLEVVS